MDNLQTFGEVLKRKQAEIKNKKIIRPPAYQWQELALQIIKELHVPNFKRNSVFRVCKDNHQEFILQCFNDTKELCEQGESWKYFFKVIAKRKEDYQKN